MYYFGKKCNILYKNERIYMKFYKRIRKFLVLLCVFTSINTSIIYADINKHFNFKNLTIEDGLSQSTVETIFQDSKGYIWFGTNDGLDRYNQ